MAKWFKRLVIIGVVLFSLLLITLIALPFYLKGKIEPMVKEQINANLNATVEWGEWDLTIWKSFPDLTIEVENVKVCNKAPFEGICLARIGKFTATLDIKSVLREQVDVKMIGLVQPDLHVVVLPDGSANYDIAKPSEGEETADTTQAAPVNIQLREYWIEDGRIRYEDAPLEFSLFLGGLDHKGSGDLSLDRFVLSTETHADTADLVFAKIRYLRNVEADIQADIDMDMANMKFAFKENTARLNKLVLGLDGWLAMPGDPIDMDLTWDLKQNELGTILSLVPAEFASDLEGVDMQGTVAFNGFVNGTYTGDQLPAFALNVGVKNGRFKYPDLPQSVERIEVDLSVTSPQSSDLDQVVVDVPRFAMVLAEQPLDGRLHMEHPITDPDIDTELRTKLDLSKLEQVVPMGDQKLSGILDIDARVKGRLSAIEAQRYNDFVAEGNVLLQDMDYHSDSIGFPVGIDRMELSLSPRFLALNSYAGTIGSSDVQASGRFDNYLQWWLSDSTLTGSFNLRSSRMDLNELMASEETEAATTAEADTVPMEVFEVPGNIDFRLNTEIGSVLYDDLVLDQVRGAVHIFDKKVGLDGLSFGLFKGQVEMDGVYSTQDITRPTVNMRYDIREMDIEPTVEYIELVGKVAPIAKTCKGRYSTSLSMMAELDQHMQPIMNSLTGQGTLRSRDLRVDGFQPLVDIAKALKISEIQSTSMQDIDFSYEFKDGRMITKPFDVKIDKVKANVGGSTAFEDQSIDYDMKAKVPTSMFGAQATSFVSGLLGQANQAVGSDFKVPEDLDVTVKITGTVTKPIIKPVFAGGNTNVKDVVVEEVKQELNEQIDKAKEEAIAQARAEADKLMAEAQKQADALKASARREAANLKAQAYKAADDELAKVTNPLAKMAAKLVADKAKEEADKQEQRAIAEADRKADAVVAEARKQGDALILRAEQTNTTIK